MTVEELRRILKRLPRQALVEVDGAAASVNISVDETGAWRLELSAAKEVEEP